jgi:hypothetical protein
LRFRVQRFRIVGMGGCRLLSNRNRLKEKG